MPGVNRLNFDGAPLPAWEVVRDRLAGMKDGDSLALGVGEDAGLVVLFVADLGYLVSGTAVGDKEYFAIVDRHLGDEIVTAFDGGDTHQFPRYVFVGRLLMLKAVETYFRTGQRDQSCEWVDARDTMYD